jgi:hypothetical protein
MSIARARRLSIISRSAPSSFSFQRRLEREPKNAAFTASVDSLGIAADAPNGRQAAYPDPDELPLSFA